jgi:hypothetical protein
VTAEAEQGEGDQGIRGLEPERDSGDQSHLGVGRLDQAVARLCSIAARILTLCLTMLFASFTNAGMRQRRAHDTQQSGASTAASWGMAKIVRRASRARGLRYRLLRVPVKLTKAGDVGGYKSHRTGDRPQRSRSPSPRSPRYRHPADRPASAPPDRRRTSENRHPEARTLDMES